VHTSRREARDPAFAGESAGAISSRVTPEAAVSLTQPVIGVTGASGLLGRHVMAHLARTMPESPLIALGRRDPGFPRTEWRSCDLEMTQAPDLTGVDVVVHLAAEKRNPAKMDQVNMTGTRRLVEAMLGAGVRRLVHLSSVGVYGAGSEAGIVSEASPREPKNEYERTKAAAEAFVEAAARENGLELLVLQPSNVLAIDSGRHHPLLGFASAVAHRRFAFIGRSPATLNYLAPENISVAIEFGISRRSTGIFVLNTPIALTHAIRIITDELDLPYPRRRMPRRLALIAGAGADAVAKVTGRSLPFSLSRVRELTNATVFDGSRALSLYGAEYPVSIEKALADLMREYRTAALL
jgi:nucleoside-diphosphate-sugar epimerase